MSGIRITGSWTRKQTARWLDEEVGQVVFWQVSALIAIIVLLFAEKIAFKVHFVWETAIPCALVGTIAMSWGFASIVFALDRRTGLTWTPSYPYPLRPHLLITWMIFLGASGAGTVRMEPLVVLGGIGMLVSCRYMLPRPWWRGVDRTPPSPVD